MLTSILSAVAGARGIRLQAGGIMNYPQMAYPIATGGDRRDN